MSSGAYLDYELNWNRGDDSQGNLTVSGLARSDWSISARQYNKIDNRTTLFAQSQITALRTLYSSGNINRQMDGYQLNLSGSASRTLRGLPYNSEQYSMVAEKDPTKVGSLPLRLYYGMVASHSGTQSSTFSSTQTAYGPRARMQLLPLTLDRNSSLNASLSVSHLSGHNTSRGLTIHGSTNLSYRASKDASLLLTYDYMDDKYTNSFGGKQRLSAQGSYYTGKVNLNVFASKSLDAQRATYFVDATYRFSNVWRLAYSYTFDQYLTEKFADYTIGLVYTFGWRDFGLMYNARTKRFGVQVLGASFN